MNKVDSTDIEIARLLGKNARQNSETLAKQLKLSAATVRRRLRALIRRDLISIVGVVDPTKFGFPLLVTIALDVENAKVEIAMEELSKRPEIRFLSAVTGRYDIIALARFRSTKGLSEFMTKQVGKLEGIKDSETFVCMEVKTGSRTPLAELS